MEIGEASGVIASPEQAEVLHKLWNPGDVIAAAIGQSDTLVTPVQLAAYAATLANRGLRLQSHLVSCVKSYTLVKICILLNLLPFPTLQSTRSILKR